MRAVKWRACGGHAMGIRIRSLLKSLIYLECTALRVTIPWGKGKLPGEKGGGALVTIVRMIQLVCKGT